MFLFPPPPHSTAEHAQSVTSALLECIVSDSRHLSLEIIQKFQSIETNISVVPSNETELSTLQHLMTDAPATVAALCNDLRLMHHRLNVVSTYVKSVFLVHVGGTRCVTWSIDRILQIHARITWGVEFIRCNFFSSFYFMFRLTLPLRPILACLFQCFNLPGTNTINPGTISKVRGKHGCGPLESKKPCTIVPMP